jgi:hypothetical protein
MITDLIIVIINIARGSLAIGYWFDNQSFNLLHRFGYSFKSPRQPNAPIPSAVRTKLDSDGAGES